MRELLEYLVGALVEKPEAVKVEEFEEDDGTLVLELSVDDDDYGRVIETIGRYNAQTDPSEIVLDRDRLQYWLDRGAQPSHTVKKLMRAGTSASA